jgi:hypothetical protein
LAFQIGFIHSLPENEFDTSKATITDVGFRGMFPKALLTILNQYAKKIESNNMDRMEFTMMIEKLVTTFIYRPITIQKVIQILISRKNNELECEEQEVN